jgi:hypothetical protein
MTSHGIRQCLLSVGLSGALACATTPTASKPESARPLHAGPAAAADASSARELFGSWAEYWAVEGGADTQRYVFLEDGRFAWLAPASSVTATALQKTGTFALERNGAGQLLVLRVTAERFAACSEKCAHHDEAARRVEHTTPVVERHEIGDCAPNLEAQALDAQYACRAIGGRAFWRRGAAGSDVQRLFE